jgi:hypothetical protein
MVIKYQVIDLNWVGIISIKETTVFGAKLPGGSNTIHVF